MPRYFPGDVVTTKAGGVGVIAEANVIINGSTFRWYEASRAPAEVRHGWPPSYAIDWLPGKGKNEKRAWWKATEWASVVLGPVHAALKEE